MLLWRSDRKSAFGENKNHTRLDICEFVLNRGGCQLIFESVTVENWRGFYREQTIHFSTSKKKNTTIVYAQNGVGKTNLLNAIMWCLYEELTASFKIPTDILNHYAASEGRNSYHVSIYLRSEDDQLYKIQRSGGNISNFKVHVISEDGNHSPYQGSAKLFVNSILPKDMAGYFINDGEGDDLTSDANGMISISRSIEDILGFGMAKRALDDVVQIRKEYFVKWKALNREGDLSSEIVEVEILQNDLEIIEDTLKGDQEILGTYDVQLAKINSMMGNSDIPTIKAKQQKRSSHEMALSKAKSNLKLFRAKKKTLIKDYATASFSADINITDLDFLEKENERLKNEAEKAEIKKANQIDMDRMRKKAEETARAASQAPVERQGEVREELLEEYLEKEFPTDKFEAVKKGQKGGDIIQSVIIKGEPVGNILYESKDVLNFDEKWVQKLLNDMSKVDATVGFIFTKAMPKKSKGFVEEREGGRVIICSEYPILRQLVSTTRKLIQANKANIASNKDEISPKLKDLFNYLNSNEFRIQTRKIFNGIKKDGEQIDKDERSGENQIKNRRKNLEDSKKNINGVITSLVSNAGLSDDILDGDDDDLLLE